jgi:hypothetical protein
MPFAHFGRIKKHSVGQDQENDQSCLGFPSSHFWPGFILSLLFIPGAADAKELFKNS